MLTSSKNVEGDFLHISQETHDKLKRSQLQAGDILFSMAGVYLGKTAILRQEDVPANTNQAVAIIRVDQSKCNNEYVYYFLNIPEVVKTANTVSSQSAQPNINLTQIGQLIIKLPPVEAQERIVDILSAYDNLIDNNRKQTKLLEEAAQRLYKEWFIDLHFPGWETTPIHDGIPEGWEMTTLGELIDFNPKYTVPKAVQKRVFPMSSLSTTSMVLDYTESSLSISVSGARFSNGDTLLARITPCLENGKTAYVDGLQAGEVAIGSTEFTVMRSEKLNPYIVYLLARSSDFRKTAINSMTGSDGRQRAQVDKLKLFPYLRPSQGVVDAFEHLAKPLFEQIYNLNKQISGLIESRDRLLPKLMTGEMEV